MSNQSMLYSRSFLNAISFALIFVTLIDSKGSLAYIPSSQLENHFIVPSFSLLELQSNRRSDELASALSTTGIIAVTGIDDAGRGSNGLSKNRQKAFRGLCTCMTTSDDDFINVVDNTDRSLLSDGLTTRTSIATATFRSAPLSLPKEQIEHVCGVEVPEAMEALRDYVSLVSDAFLGSLDRLIHQSLSLENTGSSCSRKLKKSFLLRTLQGKEFNSVKDIVDASQNLEHFHVYSRHTTQLSNHKSPTTGARASSFESVDSALPTHVDAGLFLGFVPAYSCHSEEVNNVDLSFYVNVDGMTKPAIFPSDSVIMMLGAGAEHWLRLPSLLPLRATKHAVKMREGNIRAWYGMMHLVPENAVIQEYPKSSTFADMRHLMSVSSATRRYSDTNPLANSDVAIGCGVVNQENEEEKIISSSRDGDHGTSSSLGISPRRRLSMVPDASYCNNSTNFYCWMSCLDIPEYESAAQNLKSGESLYCLNPSTLFQTNNVSQAVRPCENQETNIPGGAMNTNCMGSWQLTAPGVPAQDVVINSTQPARVQPYCYGATSMYMEGFQWHGNTCVVYLFPSWVITSTWKMIVACLGTLMLAASLEGIIFARRMLVRRFSMENIRLAVSTLVYGCQLTLAYCIMLVVMTYSGPLFLSAILGLMLGHLAFSIMTKKEISVDEGATPCCLNDIAPVSHTVEGSSSSCCSTGETDILKEQASVVSYNTLTVKQGVHDLGSLVVEEEQSCCCDADIESH